MPAALSLTRAQLGSIYDHALRHRPEEACGILAGDADGRVRRVFEMENAEHSSSFYMMDSQEQFQVFDQIEQDGLQLVGIFHSHPHSPAYPSARDCELAFYPDALYMIVSLMDGRPASRAFSIREGTVEEARLLVSGE